MQNLLVRILSGIVYVAALLGAAFNGNNSLVLLSIVFAFFSFGEWISLKSSSKKSFKHQIWLFLIVSFPILGLLNVIPPSIESIFHFISICLFTLLCFQIAFSKKEGFPETLYHYAFGLVYIGLPLFLLPEIVYLTGNKEPWLLVSIFILIWSTDSFAYLVGRFFGRRKFFERISPKKTWEGFFGGAFFTTVISLVLHHYIEILPLFGWIGLALIVIVFGAFGDLLESAFKRKYGIKDSGKFLPGHGGILDRIDSLLIVLPIAYFYLQILVNHYL
jgi:phosphatidate cytidylyltransferase